MRESWRWFGPLDKISLPEIVQTGASGIVTALHEIPYGEVWPREVIAARSAQIAAVGGLQWAVVESLPVDERIKRGEGDLSQLFANYRQSMANLAACGIRTICYNFMPLLDWTRTRLDAPVAGGGVMDFAGGIVVHATAGTAALVCAVMIGKRRNFPASLVPPHSPVLTMIGASMLWVGWFGFNGGSALGAGNNAGMALLVTHIAAATASLTWMFIEWRRFGRPSLVGIVTGMVAGLATVTPASGFIGVPGGLILGLVGGVGCYLAVDLIRVKLQIDDSLDVFAVHGVGGILGSLLVAFLALPIFGGLGLGEGVSAGAQFMVQLKSVVITVIWTAIASAIILTIVRMFGGLRVDAEVEVEGLDLSEHGERGYHTS